jgi:hypothetical protein
MNYLTEDSTEQGERSTTMGRGRILTAATTFVAVLAITAGSAVAATPRQIYLDLAQHGKLTKHYSAADLNRAAKNAALQGYGGVGSQPVVAGVAGAQAANGGAAPATQASGSLPFTGLQLTAFMVIGLALVGGGILLHRAGRGRSSQ